MDSAWVYWHLLGYFEGGVYFIGIQVVIRMPQHSEGQVVRYRVGVGIEGTPFSDLSIFLPANETVVLHILSYLEQEIAEKAK